MGQSDRSPPAQTHSSGYPNPHPHSPIGNAPAQRTETSRAGMCPRTDSEDRHSQSSQGSIRKLPIELLDSQRDFAANKDLQKHPQAGHTNLRQPIVPGITPENPYRSGDSPAPVSTQAVNPQHAGQYPTQMVPSGLPDLNSSNFNQQVSASSQAQVVPPSPKMEPSAHYFQHGSGAGSHFPASSPGQQTGGAGESQASSGAQADGGMQSRGMVRQRKADPKVNATPTQ